MRVFFLLAEDLHITLLCLWSLRQVTHCISSIFILLAYALDTRDYSLKGYLGHIIGGTKIINTLQLMHFHGYQNNNTINCLMLAGEKLVDGAAILEYRWIRDGVADLFHTEVPTAYRGKGIAKILAKVPYLLVNGFSGCWAMVGGGIRIRLFDSARLM